MKVKELHLLFPKRKYSETSSMRIFYEFLLLLGVYFILHLIYSYSNESSLTEVLPETSSLRKLIQFPISSFVSLFLIIIFILLSSINRKFCLWILAEKNREFSKIFTLEVLSFSAIVLEFLLLILISFALQIKEKISIFESLSYLIINISIFLYFSFLYIKRNILYSYYYLGQDKKRAFLVLLIPISFLYLLLKGVV